MMKRILALSALETLIEFDQGLLRAILSSDTIFWQFKSRHLSEVLSGLILLKNSLIERS